MATPSLATEAAKASNWPGLRFNQRERKLLSSVKTYVDSLSPETLITTEGDIIVGAASGVAQRLAKGSSGLPLVAGASTVSYAQLAAAGIASSAVTLAKLHSGITPSHVVKYAGTFTTVGGDATESITVSGVLGTDIVSVQTASGNTNVLRAVAATDAITVTLSADPGNDDVLNYIVYRAAS